jgi:hypothetical protein
MQISAADYQFGQPVHETHPHLLEAGESKSFINCNVNSNDADVQDSHAWYHGARVL